MLKKIPLLNIALISFLLLIVFICGRTFLFSSGYESSEPLVKRDLQINIEKAVRHLSAVLKIATVSGETSKAKLNFNRLHGLLRHLYPQLHQRLQLAVVNGQSLLYEWQGTDKSLAPILFIAHMDVVPVGAEERAQWKFPPFSGQVDKGVVWGRGALDDKSAIIALFESIEYLLSHNFKPKRSLYIALGHDEETGGLKGAAEIAKQLMLKKIKPLVILDEWSGVFDAQLLKANKPVALVAVAEKGYMSVVLEVKSNAGHSSKPPKSTVIDILSRAIAAVNSKPMSTQLSEPVKTMFERLSSEMGLTSRIVITNSWLFKSVLLNELAAKPVTNAMVRTTFATTLFNAGVVENQLPVLASALINVRLLPGTSAKTVLTHIRLAIDDSRVKVSVKGQVSAASKISSYTSKLYQVIEASIKQEFNDVLVVPGLLIGASDSRHYQQLNSPVYRFRPFRLNHNDIASVHGVNEKISLTNLAHSIRFYIQLIENLDSNKF